MEVVTMWAIRAEFFGCDGYVTLRSGHVRTFHSQDVAEAFAARLRQRVRYTHYTVEPYATATSPAPSGRFIGLF